MLSCRDLELLGAYCWGMRARVRFAWIVVATGCLLAISACGTNSTVAQDGHCSSSIQAAGAGWAVRVPVGWHVLGFSDATGKVGAVGSQFSNFALPAPRLVAGYPIQVNDRVLPNQGVGLIIATDTDPRISPHELAALPLPLPNTPNDRWTLGSAPAGQPYLETLWFRISCATFIASAKIGPDASHSSLQELASIVASLRHQPARGQLPREMD